MNAKTLLARTVLPLVAIALAGCASTNSYRHTTGEADARLDRLVERFEDIRAATGNCQQSWKAGDTQFGCTRIRREAERLAMEFPAHAGIQLASAILHYDAGSREQAQVRLDMLLGSGAYSPEAFQLRARIALEAGNHRLARRLVDQALRQYPRVAELHELSAAVHYLDEAYAPARRALTLADKLGAASWRVDYHRGLLNEAEGQWPAACLYYEAVLIQKPRERRAEARRYALVAEGHCDIAALPRSSMMPPG